MKRIVVILVVGLGTLFVSCEKQAISPNSTTKEAVPVWRSTSSGGGISSENGSAPTVNGSSVNSVNDDGSITDPNNDRDENSKKKPTVN